ncbi:N-acetylglucosamine-6-phosphate deacetylase [Candidatus Bipolaricaulota bacterium]|nr:N-acetylglucosamine-6-phosphate deacetylase [Candidatus Bipolaricaulota bacterium]
MEKTGTLLIRNARLVTPTGVREGDCLVQDGRIVALGEVRSPGPVPELDAAGRYLAPGFLDLHVHGGAGADFMDGDPAAARAIARFHAQHGTTGLLATIVPGPLDRMRRAMAAVIGIPGILGIHLEGPFLNPEKAGALDAGWLLPPGRDAFRRLAAGFEGQIKVVTFAPELPGALDLVAEIGAIGAVPSIGHTAATYEQATAALVRGARHVTHLGNAMAGLHHRAPGSVGAALLSTASLELIPDGIHLHPAFFRLAVEFLRGRGELHRLCLVTDATAAAGMPAGSYRLGDREVRLERGEVHLADGTLAGSALTLDQALRNAVGFAHLSPEGALTLVTTNPARVLGLDAELGSLAVGTRADLVLLDPELAVSATVCDGEISPGRG